MSNKSYNYGDVITGFRAEPHPTKRGEYVSKSETATIIGFSHESCAKRNWGWRGSALVEFADGHKTWNQLH
jgi:hypothetical protein